jgi:hypothetical protein
MIKTFEEFKYVTNTTFDNDFKYDFVTKNKLMHGKHNIKVYIGDKYVSVNAKFDTGAQTSSIDINKAKELGIGDKIVSVYGILKTIPVDKTIDEKKRKELEKRYTKMFKKHGILKVKLIKSASGFSFRLFIKAKVDIYGRILDTDINITDRKGLDCDMIVGLKDLI